jgi:hypothetical protein
MSKTMKSALSLSTIRHSFKNGVVNFPFSSVEFTSLSERFPNKLFDYWHFTKQTNNY